ncbi:MAG: glycosyltransferase family 2 protein, partial [Terriglobia bacterium]
TAMEHATGDFIAFLDDDEFPSPRWLLTLFEAWKRYGVAGVLGPVKPYFDEGTPGWVMKGKFYERATYSTGTPIHWDMGRSGNTLFERRIIDGLDEPFRREFHRGGADKDFFRRMIENGHSFVWCDEAMVYEVVPPVRWKRSYMLRKALLSGSFAPLHPTAAAREIATSLVAVPCYLAALPFGLAAGHHIFMTHLEKLCYHVGRLSGYAGVKLVKAPHLPH